MTEEKMEVVVSGSADDLISSAPVPFTFDITTYASRYEGCTKIERLMFIAERVNNKREVYILLIDELRRGNNTALYRKICAEAIALFGESFIPNDDWADKADAQFNSRLEKLESDLAAAKNSMVKESIRLALCQIADFYFQRGNFKDALKFYLRTKEYCSTPKHNSEMVFSITTLSIHDSNFRMVGPYASTIDIMENPDITIKAKIKVALALVSLHDENFSVAAKKFLDIDADACANFNTVISPEDIAIYGTLLGLACLPRKDFKKSILENKNFKNFIEIVPTMKALVQDFLNGSYSQVFHTLESLKPQLLLDIYLHKCIDTLFSKISNKIIIQYFTVYNTIDMKRMSQALAMPIPILVERICHLITNESLPARIDSQTQTLHRHALNDRDVTVGKVLKLSMQHTREVKRTMLRLSLMQNGFSVVSRDANTMSGIYRDASTAAAAGNASGIKTVGTPAQEAATAGPNIRGQVPSSRVPHEDDDTEDDTEMNIDDDD